MYVYHIFVGLTFLISLCLASIIIPRILLISAKKKLFDEPDERKLHHRSIPRLGGVSFFPAIVFTFCCVLAISNMYGYSAGAFPSEYLLLICGMTLIYLTGIADDLVGVRYRQKFIVQAVCAGFFPLSGLWIDNFHGLFGIYAIAPWMGILLTVFTVVFITNAINLIDGVDGLAAGLSGISLLAFAVMFLGHGLWVYSALAMATVGVLVPFFYYNVFGNPNRARKIFMGDTGSLTLGYVISFLAVRFCSVSSGVEVVSDGAPVIALGTMIVPAFDVIRVVVVRIRNGGSPFLPDRNHIHHRLLDAGFSPRQTMVVLVLAAVGFSALNICMARFFNINVVLAADVALWTGFNFWCSRMRSRIPCMK